MIRALSLAAALALLALSAALAQDAGQDRTGAAEAALEAAAEAFEARMEEFGARAELIEADESLSETQQGAAIAALWAEYQPEVAVFTAAISQHAAVIAQQALANIDMEALVAESLNSPEVQQGIAQGAAAGAGIATNSAWSQTDPESLVTYELMAQYALDQTLDDEDEPKAPNAGD